MHESEKWKVKVKSLGRVWLFATPWTDYSSPGSSVHGIFQARVLEWVAIAFSVTALAKNIWIILDFLVSKPKSNQIVDLVGFQKHPESDLHLQHCPLAQGATASYFTYYTAS